MEIEEKNHSHYLNEDGTLNIRDWAERVNAPNGVAGGESSVELLRIENAGLPVNMKHSLATGKGLVSDGNLGADLINVAAGNAFVPHTHPGNHLLIIIAGEGTIVYGGKIYPTYAGNIYLIQGDIPHAVGAITDHTILAVGSPHKPIDSIERMVPVEYEAVVSEIRELHCLICDKIAVHPVMLHNLECPHCPCYKCVDMGEDSDG